MEVDRCWAEKRQKGPPRKETQGEKSGEQQNPKCCCLQKMFAEDSCRSLVTGFYHWFHIFWMWKPRFREHKALAEGHKASKWWVQDSNLDLTDSTPFHSLCRGSLWSRDWWREKEYNEQVDRWKENILLHLKKTTNFYNLKEKREERRKVLVWNDPDLRKRRQHHKQDQAMRKFNYFQLMEYLWHLPCVRPHVGCQHHGDTPNMVLLLPGAGNGHINK